MEAKQRLTFFDNENANLEEMDWLTKQGCHMVFFGRGTPRFDKVQDLFRILNKLTI